MFFSNQDLLHEFSQKSSELAKEEVPDASYFKQILDFWMNHYKSRQLFMHFYKEWMLGRPRVDKYVHFNGPIFLYEIHFSWPPEFANLANT